MSVRPGSSRPDADPGDNSGRARPVGLQFGGKWTEGTGTTENALCVDGRLTRIGRELQWAYDRADFLSPWTVRTPGSDQVDVTFTPFHDHRARIDVGLLANRTDQCFGHYRGRVRPDSGQQIAINGLLGWGRGSPDALVVRCAKSPTAAPDPARRPL